MSRIYNTSGGSSRMYQARVEAREDPEAPHCPQCDKPMRKRRSDRGPFWGCSGYPECKGTRPVADAE